MRAQHNPSSQPLVVGTGLVALDVIVDEKTNVVDVRAGGTCGNVLTILGYLGWRSVPLARLERDAAYSLIASDFGQWGIETAYLGLGQPTPTPVIVEVLRERSHRFLLVCPSCGAHLPAYRPVTIDAVQTLPDHLRTPDVFFFDRLSPAAILLAEDAHAAGGLVVCEPSSIKDRTLLRRALAVTDIFKVSSDRVSVDDLQEWRSVPLLIETRGASGLRYRVDGKAWKTLGAFSQPAVRDTAGAGDWCTAGLLFRLESLAALRTSRFGDADALYDAISFGQALGAWTCAFVGPRGGMYQTSRSAFWESVKQLLKRRIPKVTFPETHEIAASAGDLACTECDAHLVDSVRTKASTTPKPLLA